MNAEGRNIVKLHIPRYRIKPIVIILREYIRRLTLAKRSEDHLSISLKYFIVLFFIAAFFAYSVRNVTANTPELSKDSLTLYVGEVYQLKKNGFSGKVKWISSKAKVAFVKNGKIRALRKGKTIITASNGSEKAQCRITVKKTRFSSDNLTVLKDEEKQLSLYCNAIDEIKWSVSDPGIIEFRTQDKNLIVIKGLKKGSAVVTAQYLNRLYKCRINVQDSGIIIPKEPSSEKNNLLGKKIVIYGSSNECGNYNTSGKSWVDILADELNGTAEVVNKSVGGNTIADSVNRLLTDPDFLSYDIIIITTIRNTFRKNFNLPQSGDSKGFTRYMYLLYDRLEKDKQEVYFASCLPFKESFKSLSCAMPVYDGITFRICSELGFKYLDMHSWLGFSDSDSEKYTSDGAHYVASIHPIIAKKCLYALKHGGELLRPYKAVKKGRELYSYLELNNSFVTTCLLYQNTNYYSIDSDFNVVLYLWLTSTTDIPEGSQILNNKDGISFFPEYSCLYGRGQWGAFRMYIFGRTIMDDSLMEGKDFVIQINSKALYDMV